MAKKERQRRHKGEGSIQELANGKYKVTVTIGRDANGKQVRRTYTAKSNAEAVRKLTEFKKERDAGRLTPKATTTVETLAERWLTVKARKVRASTYRLYEMAVRVNINPTIGKKKIQSITTAQINDLVDKWIADGELSMSTIKTHRTILRNLFDFGVREGLLAKNPVQYSSTVRVESKDMRVLSQEEAQRLLGYAKEHGRGPIYHLLLLALATGMRRGELLGLSWDNVLESSIRVWRNLIQTKEGFKVDAPKTNSGRRTISVAKWVLDEVRTLQEKDAEFVFRWPDREGSCSFTTAMTEARRCLGEVGLKGVRFHDLRHTHATQLITSGVDVKTVSKRLGHENITTTLNLYAHWLPERDQEAAERMGDWLTITESSIE